MSKAREGFHCVGLAVQLDSEQSLFCSRNRGKNAKIWARTSHAHERRKALLAAVQIARATRASLNILRSFPRFSREKKKRLLAVYAVPKLRVRTWHVKIRRWRQRERLKLRIFKIVLRMCYTFWYKQQSEMMKFKVSWRMETHDGKFDLSRTDWNNHREESWVEITQLTFSTDIFVGVAEELLKVHFHREFT